MCYRKSENHFITSQIYLELRVSSRVVGCVCSAYMHRRRVENSGHCARFCGTEGPVPGICHSEVSTMIDQLFLRLPAHQHTLVRYPSSFSFCTGIAKNLESWTTFELPALSYCTMSNERAKNKKAIRVIPNCL
jgi:hypothetical protein